MAKTPPAAEEKDSASETKGEQAQPAPKQKLLVYGAAVFVIQIVVIYFVVVKFIMPPSPHEEAASPKTEKTEQPEKVEQHIFVIKDLIINPAGTNGTRFLLTTIGFEVSTPEAAKDLENREIQVRDILNTVLTGKGLDDLASVKQREALRTEIAEKVRTVIHGSDLKNVYFSKFIIQ